MFINSPAVLIFDNSLSHLSTLLAFLALALILRVFLLRGQSIEATPDHLRFACLIMMVQGFR